ncbi:MAG: hypothetical protein FJ118_05710 [Deltaproteobacteria bacterium]|nr:hypothetical protein [Deltaproteobacteria bacterium]
MFHKSAIILAVAALLAATWPVDGYCWRLNPYAPHNAVAAEPMTPYNELEIYPPSLLYQRPCPSCVPAAYLLPDLPPVRQPARAPLGIPVPVP